MAAPQVFWLDEGYDREHASDGVSRYAAEVRERSGEFAAEDGVVRAAPQGEVLLSFLADDRDRAQPKGPPELDRGGSDASRGAMHQQGVPRLRVCPPGQREQCGQVVQGGSRTRLEAHAVRQWQHPCRRDGHDLLPAAVLSQHRHALARSQPGAGRSGADYSSGVHAGRIRKRHFHLVGAPGLQQVRERHTGSGDIDKHATVGCWLLSFNPLKVIGACEVHNLMSEHLLLLSCCARCPLRAVLAMIHSHHLDEDQLRGADADQLEVPTAWTSFPMRRAQRPGVAPDLGGPAMAGSPVTTDTPC